MKELTDIKEIWLSAKVEMLPDAEEAVRLIKHYRFKMIVKKAAAIFLLLLMIILMLYVVFYGNKMLVTRIGEAGFFIGIFVLFTSNVNSLKRAFRQVNRSNREFIEYLKQAQRGRAFFYKKEQPVTFLIVSLSLFLICFESVYQNAVLMSVVYSILGIYVLVMWFIVRPRVIKKQTKKLNETIEKLEALTK